MPPGMTLEFLSAVQNQLSISASGDQQQQIWMAKRPDELSKLTHMWLLGK